MLRNWLKAHQNIILVGLSILILTIISIYVHIRLINNAADDAYIHIRIAQHLAEEGVPYFNPDEPILATSSTGWTILLGLLFLIFPATSISVAVLNGIFLMAGATLLTRSFQLLTEGSYHKLIYFIFFLSVISLTFTSSIELMETAFAVFLLSVSIYLYLKKWPVFFIILGVLPFFRMEFAFFSAALFFVTWLKERKVIFPVFLMLLGALPFIAFDLVYFHTLIPNTVLAKSVVYDISAWQKTYEILCSLVTLTSQVTWIAFAAFPFVLFAIAISILYFVRDMKLARNAQRPFTEASVLPMILLFCAILVMGFYVIGGSAQFDWYIPLYTIPLFIPVFLQMCRKKNVILGLLVLCMLVGPIKFMVTSTFAILKSPEAPTLTVTGARVTNYIRLGQWLNSAYPEATLCTSEIGGLGYGFHGKIIDGAGLVSPQALKFHPMKVPEERENGTLGAIPLRFIQETRPEIIVSYDFFVKQFLESDYSQEYIRISLRPLAEKDRLQFADYEWFQTLNLFIRQDIYQAELIPPQ